MRRINMGTCPICGGHKEDGSKFVGRRCTCKPKADEWDEPMHTMMMRQSREIGALRRNVSDLQQKLSRVEGLAAKFSTANVKRKQQQALDDKFKKALKRKNPKLYDEIVTEITGVRR